MQEVLPILTLFLAPFSLSIPIKSFICPGFMFIQQALVSKNASSLAIFSTTFYPTFRTSKSSIQG
jgi:hypothetical protein